MKKVLFTATVDTHIKHFHIPFLMLFKKKGYEVHVSTNGNEKFEYCDKKYQISFERSPFSLKNIKAYFALKKIIEKEKYDIIHTHTPMGSIITRLAARKVRKKYGTKVIYTAHGFHFYKGASIINWILYYPIEKLFANFTDELITINKEDYNKVKNNFNTNVHYLPGVGINKEKFNKKIKESEKVKLMDEININKEDFVIVQVGELNDNKNQIASLKAMKEIIKTDKSIKLIIAGSGVNEMYLKKYVKDNNLMKNVIFLGYRTDIPKILSISNLLISTSKREGLPVNIIESLFMDVPVIAMNCRGAKDLIKDKINGYVIEIDDISNLIKNIKLIKNKPLNSFKFDDIYLLENIINKIQHIYFKKKRILHLLSSNKYSGAENVVCTMIDTLKNEYSMSYCSPKGKISEILRDKNINYIPIKSFNVRNIKKVIKDYKPDIIHAHDYKASIILNFINYKGKIISQIHKNDPKVKKLSIKSLMYKFSSKKFNKIIFISKSIIDEYIYKDIISKKTYILENYINKDMVIKKSKEFKTKKKYDLFFLGRLSKEKNPLLFIEIVNKLNDKNLNAIMIGDGNLKNDCLELIKKYKLTSRIDLVGFKSNPYPYIAASRIGIMPSVFEGFGLAAIEGLILDKPVLNSGAGGLKKIFKDNKDYICYNINDYIMKINDNEFSNYSKIVDKYTNKDKYKKELIDIYNI